MLPDHLAKRFPKLRADGGRKTSEATNQYNCVAWSAARDELQWWEPEQLEPWYYWPSDVKAGDYSFENFVRLFENRGYTEPSDSSFELRYKKVALYAIYGYYEVDKWGFSHVCDQLNSGLWMSKLGPDEDIKHRTLPSLEGDIDEYGEVRIILKKPCGFFEILVRAFFKIYRSFLNVASAAWRQLLNGGFKVHAAKIEDRQRRDSNNALASSSPESL